MKNSTDNLKAKQATKEADKADQVQTKFLFQFINHENGQRSKPFTGTWDDVTEVLAHRGPDERPKNEDYILLVAVFNGDQTTIPATPLITVGHFEEITKENPTPQEAI